MVGTHLHGDPQPLTHPTKMVTLSAVEDINAAVVQRHLVAVFFGGTSGIGELTLRALAKTSAAHNGKGFRAYIVGRKPESAAAIAADCKKDFAAAEVEFVKVDDLALIRNVDKACAEIIRREKAHGKDARIDYLMLSPGGAIYCPRRGRWMSTTVG